MWVRLNDDQRSNINFAIVSQIQEPFYYPGMGGVLNIHTKKFDNHFKSLHYKTMAAAKKDYDQLMKALNLKEIK